MKLFEIAKSREETMHARKVRRVQIFVDWFETQKFPPEYDRDMLQAAALDNVSDVPVNKIVDGAKATVALYLDDPEMAQDAGIIDYWGHEQR
jgi:hypothetical protein